MRTSDPDIYAAGDCVEATDLVTGKPCYVPMGSTANKQGRVAAINICGGQDRFPGVLGSTVCKVFDFCVARTGLTEAAARRHGYHTRNRPGAGRRQAPLHARGQAHHHQAGGGLATRKLLGAQAVGPGAGDKRMDVAAMAITAGMTVDQLSKVDLCYAPPYSPAMDDIITAANVARNKLDGQMAGITPMEVKANSTPATDFLLLDVRSSGRASAGALARLDPHPVGDAARAVGRIAERQGDRYLLPVFAPRLRSCQDPPRSWVHPRPGPGWRYGGVAVRETRLSFRFAARRTAGSCLSGEAVFQTQPVGLASPESLQAPLAGPVGNSAYSFFISIPVSLQILRIMGATPNCW